jgi:hypothetical protein
MSGTCQHGRTQEQGCTDCMETAARHAVSSLAAPNGSAIARLQWLRTCLSMVESGDALVGANTKSRAFRDQLQQQIREIEKSQNL